MAFTREDIKKIEQHIESCKNDNLFILADQNNDTYPDSMVIKCKKCGIQAKYKIDRDYIHACLVECPICSNEGRVTVLGLNVN